MNTFIVRLSNNKDIVCFCDATMEEIVKAYKNSCNLFNFQFHERIKGDPEDRFVIASENNKMPEDVYLRLLEQGCPFNEMNIHNGEFKENNIGSLFTWFLTKGFERPIEIAVTHEQSLLLNYMQLYDEFTPLTIGNAFSKTLNTASAYGGGGIANIENPWRDIRIRL